MKIDQPTTGGGGGGGTVTSVATTAPITGGTITGSGTIGITQASGSTDGYLSSTDWTTFNNKFTLPALTSGSVLFSNGTTIAQDNANFNWDDALDKLSIGGVDTMTVNGSLIGSKLSTHSADSLTQVDIEMHKHSATAGAGAAIYGARSRGGIGTETIVQDGDAVLNITGVGYDGTDYATLAQIQFEVDGTPGSNDMPGRIIFNTSANGGQTLTERMRISQNGKITIGSLAGSGTRVVTADAQGTLDATNNLITGSGTNTMITYWTGTSTIAGSAAFSWNDTTKRFVITNGGSPAKRALQVDAINFDIAMGDTATFVNGTQLLLSDTSQNVQINGSDGLGTTGSVLDIYTNLATGFGAQVFIGDVSGLVNETVLEVSDAGLRIEGRGANYRGMRLDFASDILTFGDVGQFTSGALNIGSIEIGASGQFTMYGLAADSTIAPFMAILGPGDIYFGDLNGVGSATTFSILESSGGLYDFTSPKFQIRGLAYNFPNTQAISGQALVAQNTSGTLLYQNVQRNYFAQTQSVTVANTTTPTTITGTGEGSLLVRSNTAKVGSTYELDFEGFYTSTSSANIGYKLKILGTNIGSSITNTLPDNSAGWDVRGHFKLTVLTTGASGTAVLNGYITYDKNDGTSVTYPLNQTAFQAIDTTINQTTDFVATWSAADPLNSLTIRQLTFNQTR